MCKLRLIIKKQERVAFDDWVEMPEADSSRLNIVDRPDYILFHDSSEKNHIKFNFIPDSENRETYTSENINITYGKLSGRIFDISFPVNEISPITRIKASIVSEKDTPRFKTTMYAFFGIIKKTIDEVKRINKSDNNNS